MSPNTRLIDGLGLWLEDLTEREWVGSAALFLDRDGVIIEDRHYVGRPEEVRLVEGAAEAIVWANRCEIPVAVVTNQSGIGRGYYGWDDFLAVQKEIGRQLRLHGAHVDFVAACAYHSKARPPLDIADHPWRKPKPGMIDAISAKGGLSLRNSVLVGDKRSDLEAANAAGLERVFLVTTGHGRTVEPEFEPRIQKTIKIDIVKDLSAASGMLRDAGWPN